MRRWPIWRSLMIMPAICLVATQWVSHGWAAQGAPRTDCEAKAFLPAGIQCYFDAAWAAQDPGVCRQAADATVRFQCIGIYAERTRDPAVCEHIGVADQESQILRDSCVAGVAFARADPPLCEAIIIPELRDSCYVKLVLEANADPKLCEQVRGPVFKQVCDGN